MFAAPALDHGFSPNLYFLLQISIIKTVSEREVIASITSLTLVITIQCIDWCLKMTIGKDSVEYWPKLKMRISYQLYIGTKISQQLYIGTKISQYQLFQQWRVCRFLLKSFTYSRCLILTHISPSCSLLVMIYPFLT